MSARPLALAVVSALGALFVAASAWMAGFTLYVHEARLAGTPPPQADGIVALTGGAERIETALHLLVQDKAPVLLVSGVGHGSDLAEIARRVRLDPATLGMRVTLGRAATNTFGNAAETASWARIHAVRRLIVVTAGYHMPRALDEIARALPEATLYPVAVQPPALRGRIDLATTRLLASEYDKLLAVRLGLSRLIGKGNRL